MKKIKLKIISASTPGYYKPAMLKAGSKKWIPINGWGVGSKEDVKQLINSWRLEMKMRPDLLRKKVVRAHENVKKVTAKLMTLQGEYAEMMGKIWPNGE